jgi:hypothetical protein
MLSHRARIVHSVIAIALFVLSCTVYACTAKYFVSNPVDYQYFPPFESKWNRLKIDHLGAENLNIAQSLRSGRGFSDPFQEKTGPTAWMPPALPLLLSGLLWLTGDDVVVVSYIVLAFQALTLVATGLLVLFFVGQTFKSSRVYIATGLFFVFLSYDFQYSFQLTHDGWLLMLGMDVLLLCHTLLPDHPGTWRLALWGGIGGALAQIGPVFGLVWAALTFLKWPWFRKWKTWTFATSVAIITISPWIVRNYMVFGQFIPIKSNLFYELYQSQCVTLDGLVRNKTLVNSHPYHTGLERDQYRELGEKVYLYEKRERFLTSLQASSRDFVVRVWNRFIAATLLYFPHDRREEQLPISAWRLFPYICQPLPFLAIVAMLFCSRPLHKYERLAMCVYVTWLLPYVLVSYYGRYAFPLLGAKVFICVAAVDRLLFELETWTNRPRYCLEVQRR